MNDLLISLNLITFLWLGFWVIVAVRKLLMGYAESITFAYIILFMMFGVPLLLDSLGLRPNYGYSPGYNAASQDELAGSIYCAYISAIPLLWWLLRSREPSFRPGDNLMAADPPGTELILYYALLIPPVIVVLLSPSPHKYLDYSAIANVIYWEEDELYFNAFVAVSSMLSILGIAGILLSTSRLSWLKRLFVMVFLFFATWVNAKRLIVVTVFSMLGFVQWWKGTLRGHNVIVWVVVAIPVIILASNYYITEIKPAGTAGNPDYAYDVFRTDYFRDIPVKMTIFAELHPESMQILDYRGQSLVFYATLPVPRSIWPEKPQAYSHYFNCAMLGLPSTAHIVGGTVSTILDEPIANFGWLGMLVGPLLVLMICRIGDKQRHGVIFFLTIMLVYYFMTVHLGSFYPSLLLWIALIFAIKRRRKGRITFCSKESLPRTACLDQRHASRA